MRRTNARRASGPSADSKGALSRYTVTVEPRGISFPVEDGEPILGAGRRAGVWLPFECGWGDCGTCKAYLLKGRVKELFPQAPAIKDKDRGRNRILTCQSVALTDLVLKGKPVSSPHRAELETEDYRAVLTEKKHLSKDIHRLRFALDRPARFFPGQYAMFELERGLRRAYCMSNLPGSRELEFIVERREGGEGSERLLRLARGEEVMAELPYGPTFVSGEEPELVFIAEGVGVAGVLAILRGIAAEGEDGPEVLTLYGVPTPDELVCLEELREISHGLSSAEVIPVAQETQEGWEGVRGTLSEAVAQRLDGLEDARFYIYGFNRTVEAVRGVLLEAGISIRNIEDEDFGY